jgi:hypothetical protein
VKPHIALVPKLDTRPVEAEDHDRPPRVNEVGPEDRHAVERRTARRYMISASAEVSDVTSGVKSAARVADISITGCYLDSINSFPEGTRLCLHTRQGDTGFNGKGTVRYAKSGIGMGRAFLHLDDAQIASSRVGLKDSIFRRVSMHPAWIHGLVENRRRHQLPVRRSATHSCFD